MRGIRIYLRILDISYSICDFIVMIERKDLIIAVHDVINDLMDHLKVKRLEDVDLGVNL